MDESGDQDTGRIRARTEPASNGFLRGVVTAIRRRPRIVLLAVLAGLAVGWGYTARQPTVHRAEATFSISNYNPIHDILGHSTWSVETLSVYPNPGSKLQLAMDSMDSRWFIRRALPRIYPAGVADTESVVSRIKKGLEISQKEGAPYLRITYRSMDPAEAMSVVRGMVQSVPEWRHDHNRRVLAESIRTIERLKREGSFRASKRRDLEERARVLRRALRLERLGPGSERSVRLLNSRGPEPLRPPLITNLLLGGGMGLLGGILLVFLRHRWDPVLRDRIQVEDRLDRPLVGVLPEGGDSAEEDVNGDDSPFRRSIDVLRARLTARSDGSAKSVILVTGPVGGEGKSTVAFHLARAFARAGNRTLLADFDLRRGTLHHRVGQSRDPGVSSVLSGASIGDAIRPYGDLDVLTSGSPPAHPVELLASERLDDFMDAMRSRYDRVVLDGTSTAGLADMVEVGRTVDGVLLVLRAGSTSEALVNRTLKQFDDAGVSVLGLVLNHVPADVSPRSPDRVRVS